MSTDEEAKVIFIQPKFYFQIVKGVKTVMHTLYQDTDIVQDGVLPHLGADKMNSNALHRQDSQSIVPMCVILVLVQDTNLDLVQDIDQNLHWPEDFNHDQDMDHLLNLYKSHPLDRDMNHGLKIVKAELIRVINSHAQKRTLRRVVMTPDKATSIQKVILNWDFIMIVLAILKRKINKRLGKVVFPPQLQQLILTLVIPLCTI